MDAIENITLQELGAILMACNPMLQDGLTLGAALDGNDAGRIRVTLGKLLPTHLAARLDKLARISDEQVQDEMKSDKWWVC
ncbi:hypothetical protein PEC18_12205 [Paucibacter sp. O1-1]|nr:hypothetical protein [Paucibacter sp. O1-1]MDA3826579.1 hypothetical protein [Paucibacter sp. O1-1]